MLLLNKCQLVFHAVVCSRLWTNHSKRWLHRHTKGHHNVLFFGSDHFSLPSLKALYDHSDLRHSNNGNAPQLANSIRNLAVVTSLKGPDNAVHRFAKAQGIPVHDWPLRHDTSICQQFDIGVVVSFGHLIPGLIISSFSLGMINVHASLLPKWRGAAPVIYAILNGDRTTGVSIMKIMPKHFDVGDILAQQQVEIGANTLMPELHATLSHLGATLLLDCFKDLPSSLASAQPQRDALVQYAPKVTAALAKLDWPNASAQQVYDRYRALYSVHSPVTSWQGTPVKLVAIRYEEPRGVAQDPSADGLDRRKTPGHVDYDRATKELRVCCADHQHIIVDRLSVAGKRIMSAADFHNGFMQKLKAGVVPCFV